MFRDIVQRNLTQKLICDYRGCTFCGQSLRVWSSFLRWPQTTFMAIFELSRVDYPRNRLKFINLLVFTKPFICVLIFSPKMVFVECYRLLEYKRHDTVVMFCRQLKVYRTMKQSVFSLISSVYCLITTNQSKKKLTKKRVSADFGPNCDINDRFYQHSRILLKSLWFNFFDKNNN